VEYNRIDDVKHWLDLAAEVRARAEEMRDPTTPRMMLGIAEGYDQLAKWAESRTQRPAPAD
jgi:hypothetical protein